VRLTKEEVTSNCSLMIRGPVLCDIDENIILSAFEAIAPVRDIRQIKNKFNDKFKDFAFIEFYSPE
jgi:RNA recognition motif-containing protein